MIYPTALLAGLVLGVAAGGSTLVVGIALLNQAHRLRFILRIGACPMAAHPWPCAMLDLRFPAMADPDRVRRWYPPHHAFLVEQAGWSHFPVGGDERVICPRSLRRIHTRSRAIEGSDGPANRHLIRRTQRHGVELWSRSPWMTFPGRKVHLHDGGHG